MTQKELEGKITDVLSGIQEAASRAGRDPGEVKLLLVSKNVEPSRIRLAYEAGHREFGENRVQEWKAKHPVLPSDIRWHFVGRLQTNKVKDIIGSMALIHSLDRRELAVEIDRQARKKNIKQVPCLIQVNSSREERKGGFFPEDAESFLESLPSGTPIRIDGLMTIGPFTRDKECTRECFRQVRKLNESLRVRFPYYHGRVLSMGMSGDYRIAIEEGATIVRVGSAVFGPRSSPA